MTTTFANDRDVGNMKSGEHLTSDIDFYTLNTLCPLSEDDFSALDAGMNLIRIGEIIGIQAQPVMTGLHVNMTVDLTTAANKATYGITDSTNTSATVYTLKFAIEHTNAWLNTSVDGTVPGTLAYALVNETAMCQLPFGSPNKIVLVSTGADTQTASLTFSAIL